jgi:hypothetical protein
MWHACGKYSLAALFARAEPQVFALYKQFEGLVRECGPVTVIPQKTRVVFQVRVRFAGAAPHKKYLECGFGFRTRHKSTRFFKIEQHAAHWFTHYYKLEHAEELDDEFESWVREAYAVGEQSTIGASP